MIRWTDERAAKLCGFTHHASYYGIPVWLAVVDDSHCMILTKCSLFDFVMPIFERIELICWHILYPGERRHFTLKLGAPIE